MTSDAAKFRDALRALKESNYGRARGILQEIEGDDEAQLQLAYLYQFGLGGAIDLDAAKALYLSSGQKGNVNGLYYLGRMLIEFHAFGEASYYLELAASRDHVSAAYWAALLHSGSLGAPRSDRKYLSYLQLAAQLGHLFAKRDLVRDEMKAGGHWLARLKSTLKYQVVRGEGLYIILRNPDDWRVR